MWFTICFISWYRLATVGNCICLFCQMDLPFLVNGFAKFVTEGIPCSSVVPFRVVITLHQYTIVNQLFERIADLFGA